MGQARLHAGDYGREYVTKRRVWIRLRGAWARRVGGRPGTSRTRMGV